MSNPKHEKLISNLTLITGGARSGKSAFAEELAGRSGKNVHYIATMEEMATDHESLERIRNHKERRPHNWSTSEVPLEVAHCISELPNHPAVCILDCLSLYVSNVLLAAPEFHAQLNTLQESILHNADEILQVIQNRPTIEFLVVTNEVGSGIVPDTELARVYRDLLGWTNQKFARAAANVWLSCSGLQVRIKPTLALHSPTSI